ncbi:hypothetical protein HELRODRAFT_167928 [Helobdella robusta]|uniref:BED-type domain-containing protein n=1 Tax=Helobdella robusta TaxID=6412 RepID=T1EZZ2_HELRO|nr:hypothetical protein HELRODRAFT_167928 [Helobdella robusta]ESO10081.1 hypothetical protein HELRODRAFT_167928 [Helobdella robusta]
MKDRGKTSIAWEYFSVQPDDASKCQCLLCPSVISRGGKSKEVKKFSTSALLTHFRTKHQKEYDEMQKQVEEAKKSLFIFNTAYYDTGPPRGGFKDSKKLLRREISLQ